MKLELNYGVVEILTKKGSGLPKQNTYYKAQNVGRAQISAFCLIQRP